jgi:hypothetical protein
MNVAYFSLPVVIVVTVLHLGFITENNQNLKYTVGAPPNQRVFKATADSTS